MAITKHSDKRFGVQAQTIAFNMPKVHQINSRTMIGLSGLVTDAQTLYELLFSLLCL